MSIESLLIAAQYLDYKAETEARGEEPQDYNSFLNDTNGMDCLSLSSSEHENVGDNIDIVEPKVNHSKTNLRGSGHEKSISREVHNRLEKNRRAQMKEGFEKLKQLTPNIGGGKVSNLKLLREVTKYIKELKEQSEATQSEVRQLEMRYVTLLAQRQYLASQCRAAENQAKQSLVNGMKDSTSESEEPRKNSASDDEALMFFSRVATSADAISNGYYNADDAASPREFSKSPGSAVKTETKINEQVGWSASEKLMALCAAGKSMNSESTKDLCPPARKSAKLKKLPPMETKAPSEFLRNSEEGICAKAKTTAQNTKYFSGNMSHFKTEHSRSAEPVSPHYNVPTSGVKRKHLEDSKSPEVMVSPGTIDMSGTTPVQGSKPFSGVQNKIPTSPSVIMQASCPVPVPMNKEQGGGNSSILQKVLLNSDSSQCEAFLAKPAAIVVRSESSNERPLIHCSPSAPQSVPAKPAVTEVTKVHFPVVIQNARKTLGRCLDIENAVKIVDHAGKELPTATANKTNTSIVKFADGILKSESSESFRAIKLNPPASPVAQANAQTNSKTTSKPEKNDSMVYLLAVPNAGQKLYINGSAV